MHGSYGWGFKVSGDWDDMLEDETTKKSSP